MLDEIWKDNVLQYPPVIGMHVEINSAEEQESLEAIPGSSECLAYINPEEQEESLDITFQHSLLLVNPFGVCHSISLAVGMTDLLDIMASRLTGPVASEYLSAPAWPRSSAVLLAISNCGRNTLMHL